MAICFVDVLDVSHEKSQFAEHVHSVLYRLQVVQTPFYHFNLTEPLIASAGAGVHSSKDVTA